MPPPDQPWLAFSRMRWRGGLDRRLVRIFDDRIEVRAGRVRIETTVIPMADVYDVIEGDGVLTIVAVPEDVVITEASDADLALAAQVVRRMSPPTRPKPEPPPPPKPEPEPEPQPEPEPEPEPEADPEPEPEAEPASPPKREPTPQPPTETESPVAVRERLAPRRHPVRALLLLAFGIVFTSIAIVVALGVFALVVTRLVQG